MFKKLLQTVTLAIGLFAIFLAMFILRCGVIELVFGLIFAHAVLAGLDCRYRPNVPTSQAGDYPYLGT